VSRTIPAGLLSHYALDTHTLATCITITRTDATVLRFTSLDVALVVSGNTYLPAGLNVSGLASAAGLGVNNAELQVLPDDALGIVRTDLITGKWDHAAFSIFEVNYLNAAGGINTLMAGTLGEVKPGRGLYTVELRSLAQALQQPVGFVTQKTCRYRVGDAATCKQDMTAFTHTGSVTTATSRQVFTDSTKAQAAEYFAEGELTWTSGPNSGYRQKIKGFAAGVFTLSLPAPFTTAVGNAFTAKAGCQKRLLEDCKTKFNNVLNFGGEPHLPGVDALIKPPVTSV
jgi:uncharacterized phage protein (TIGR02218 family)